MMSFQFLINSFFFFLPSIAKAVSENFLIIFCLILLIVTSNDKISSCSAERRHLEN